MKALLLAAGVGSRLRPITDQLPKCMVEIEGRPLLDYWIETLFWDRGESVEELLINTHYLPDRVRDYVSNSTWRNRIQLIHEKELLGTGGTLVKLLPALEGSDVLVAHADNLTLFRLDAFAAAHFRRPRDCVATMMTFDTDDPRSCGIVECDEMGRVVGFHEKVERPPGRRANAAVFMFAPEGLDTIRKLASGKRVSDLSLDVIPQLLGRLSSFHNDLYHRDIGNPQSLGIARAEFPALHEAFWKSVGSAPTSS